LPEDFQHWYNRAELNKKTVFCSQLLNQVRRKRQHKSHLVPYRTISAKGIAEMVSGTTQLLQEERKKGKKFCILSRTPSNSFY